MRFPEFLKVFGDQSFRGECPTENVEQITLVKRVRAAYPDTLGKVLVHIRNEGKRTHGQAKWQKAEGMTKGASDLIFPAGVSLLIELKRRDHTKSAWSEGQIEYLEAAHSMGAFACVALGADAAMEAIECYLKTITPMTKNG